jgi:HSP20 family protein
MNMNLTRYQRPDAWLAPFDRLNTLRAELDRMFENPFAEFGRTEFLNGWVPALDVYEEKDHLLVNVEVPGMKKEDLEITLHDGTLTIAGERKFEGPVEKSEPQRSERFFGRFQRSVTLPKPVDASRVTARYADGILSITLPKTEDAKPRQIEVNVG